MSRTTTFAIGKWRADPRSGVLTRDGREERLEPRLMDLLLVFAEAPGRVIDREEIVARVWSGRAIGDDTIASAISRLRTALDESKTERYIETIPKRGYRLVADVAGMTPSRAVSNEEPEAANLVRKGLSALGIMLPPSLAQARLYFEGAIRADPRRADAHAGLAEALLTQIMMGQGDPDSLASAAKSAARASIVLDDNFASGWSVLGLATLLADRKFSAADDALQRATGLDPTLASAHRNRAFALASVGQFADSEREARRAVEVEPYSLSARNDLLQVLIVARRYRYAIAESTRTIAMSANSFQAWAGKGWSHAFLGEEEDAVISLLESLKTMGTDAETLSGLSRAHERGNFEQFCAAGADLFETQRVLFTPRPMDVAMLRTQAGQFDAAFAALDNAAERGDPVLLLTPYLPHLDRLRNDPRFPRLLERIRPVRP
jgi:DNA-binding winged helix-turn-helix (wHTH) protein